MTREECIDCPKLWAPHVCRMYTTEYKRKEALCMCKQEFKCELPKRGIDEPDIETIWRQFEVKMRFSAPVVIHLECKKWIASIDESVNQ